MYLNSYRNCLIRIGNISKKERIRTGKETEGRNTSVIRTDKRSCLSFVLEDLNFPLACGSRGGRTLASRQRARAYKQKQALGGF